MNRPLLDAAQARRRLLLVHNPTAGARRRRRLAEVLACLQSLGVAVTVRETTRRGDAERLAAAAGTADGDALAAAGGDGTLNEAANGLRPGAPPLGLVPLGTANVLAAEIGLSLDPLAVARALAFGPAVPIRPGRVNGRRFLLMAGVGFDAHVVRDVDPGLKRRAGKGAYVWEMLRQLGRYRFPRFAATLDGSAVEAASLVAARSRHYGGHFVLAPLAGLQAPALQACLFLRAGRLSVLDYAGSLAAGRLQGHPGMAFAPAGRIVVHGPAGEPVQADGDIVGQLPAIIELAPAALSLILPAGAAPAGEPPGEPP